MGWLGGVFDSVQQWLFESVLQPLMFTTGLASLLENGWEASGWLLVGFAAGGHRGRDWSDAALVAGGGDQ